MKCFLINFFAASCGVWFVWAVMMGPFIIAIPYYHWNVLGVEIFAFVCALWETAIESKHNSGKPARGADYYELPGM